MSAKSVKLSICYETAIKIDVKSCKKSAIYCYGNCCQKLSIGTQKAQYAAIERAATELLI